MEHQPDPTWPALNTVLRQDGYVVSHRERKWRISEQHEGSTNKFRSLEAALFGSEGALAVLNGGQGSWTKRMVTDHGPANLVVLKVRNGPVLLATGGKLHLLQSGVDFQDELGRPRVLLALALAALEDAAKTMPLRDRESYEQSL